MYAPLAESVKAADLRPATVMFVGSNPTGRIYFFEICYDLKKVFSIKFETLLE